ncbi:DgyrCDS11539 [Dimorphilus gyrociliatus]|uniref:Glutaminyl-peptide cyclotransferase n=1 Tax=Dimorphilus gyrociliatus TaxID=2664684 RepID=A0A7I8W4P5_9ANNE|nr:DgyrCDS11539 [Dimorphilus gyrociliatus]
MTYCMLNQRVGSFFIENIKENRTFKPLKSRQLRYVAEELSDEAEFFRLLQPILRERVAGSDGNKAVRRHIYDHMKSLGWNIELDTFVDKTPFGNREFENIIATYPAENTETLTMACHHDSKYFDEFRFIGATDSAVPCAMLLHLASRLNKLLQSSNLTERGVTLQFIFFDGEEAFVKWTEKDSIYGSRHLAEKFAKEVVMVGNKKKRRIDTIKALILLDLIGEKNPQFSNFFPDKTSKHYKALQEINDQLASSRLLTPAPNYFSRRDAPYFGKVEDDHVPWYQRGVSVLHLIAVPFPKSWHTADDDQTALHYPTIENLNRIFRVFVIEYLHLRVKV